MKIRPIVGLCLVAIFAATLLPQTSTHFEKVGSVERLDPALDAIVPANPLIEKVGGGFKFTEGPVWAHDGYLLFSDNPANAIMKWTTDGEVTVFLKPSGANGLTLDLEGRLTICDQSNRRVTRLEKDGEQTVLADRYEGKRFNSPNDLIYRSDGSLYFTDPPYGLAKQDDDPVKELSFNGIYRVARGKVELLYNELKRPNGIAFSPDEKFLCIANSDAARKVWMRFEVQRDGTLQNPQVFFDATTSTEDGLPDGMKVDRQGNLYCTGPGGLWIFSPQGKHLGTIKLPEIPANCNWGDSDGRTLYITARTGLYRVQLKIPGVLP